MFVWRCQTGASLLFSLSLGGSQKGRRLDVNVFGKWVRVARSIILVLLSLTPDPSVGGDTHLAGGGKNAGSQRCRLNKRNGQVMVKG